ncbi:MAG TPA: prolyl oligopeptidase family serine peptidase [Gemmatimonadaceae bacterium]|jgi:dipeptidyl aminopeptidase/acylaminoacyl peptidase
MYALRPSLCAVALVVTSSSAFAQQAPATTAASSVTRASGGKQMTAADLKAWKSIRSPVLSNDGKFFTYILAPNEGEATVVVRQTADGATEQRFPIGELPASVGNPFAPGGGGPASLAISGDSKFAAFTIYPSQREARRLRQQRRPVQNKVVVLNLATGQKQEFDKIRRFAFSGEKPRVIALYGYAVEAPSAAGTDRAGGAAPPASRSEGADLLLYTLATGSVINIGNVGDFAFDESGSYLAYTIDAHDEIGNGVQLRDLRTDVVRSLDSDQALYRRLAWADSGPALAVLRGKPDSATKDTVFGVVSFMGIGTAAQRKIVFDAAGRADFPSAMRVSADRTPRVADDFGSIFFGIREAKPKAAETMAGRDGAPPRPPIVQAGAPGEGGARNQPRVDPDDENPTLVLWHWKDPRLQSQQLVQEQADRTYSYLVEYRIAENKFVRLSDDGLRQVTLLPHDRYAYGIDSRDYDQRASYDGRRYADIYAVDLKTGTRTLALKKDLQFFGLAAPDGRQLLYWGDDANYWTLDLATGQKHNVTKDAPVSFANTSDDHNNIVPPPRPVLAWSKDASAVLLSDGWDVWRVPVGAGKPVNLTGDGRKNEVRYQRLYAFDEGPAARRGGGGRGGRQGGGGGGGGGPEEGIDLTKPLYFGTYGEWTKREGLARVEPNKAGAVSLVWDDAAYNFMRARDAAVYLYTKQTERDFPNYYVASADLKSGRQITDANPQQKDFAWSSGARLIKYVSDKGDTLQGALYLPANYEPGKKYPLLVTIYEKRSQLLNGYVVPSETSTPNRSIYTSRGYAVLDPDIVYRVNDPGMSAVWCVLPAVRAAIATGVIDSTHIGLWGHSWGGYQTAFLVTQTNMFHAAVAGAPLTDMVSMYSSIYWNTGGTNQGIFESSQGRFKGNFIQNYDAYIRNSPVFHADKVTTPLIILHNDKDGAVDFNQGITYFNTLRQLGKDVILLEYVGENHGLQRPVNQKDYAIRMREWFDYQLKGEPPADWIVNGVPRLKLEEQLKARRPAEQSVKAEVVP